MRTFFALKTKLPYDSDVLEHKDHPDRSLRSVGVMCSMEGDRRTLLACVKPPDYPHTRGGSVPTGARQQGRAQDPPRR